MSLKQRPEKENWIKKKRLSEHLSIFNKSVLFNSRIKFILKINLINNNK
jgi:hypothetical protein